MNKNQAKDLFQLQSELVDTKVDMAVSKAIDRVVQQITDLRAEMHIEINGLKNEMHEMRQDITGIEATLTFIKDTQREIRSKFIEYTFKAGWIMLATSIAYVVLHSFGLIK